MIIGIDIGASTTDIVAYKNNEFTYHIPYETNNIKERAKSIPELVKNSFNIKEITKIAITGGGARFVEKIFNIPVVKIDEIQAIARGAMHLAKEKNIIAVSMGTGTAIVYSYFNQMYKFVHIGGTGVGGGTIKGLSKILLKTFEPRKIDSLALKGSLKNVDITVGEIIGKGIGILPSDITAANLAKLSSKSKKEDIAAGIINMVAQTIGTISILSSNIYNTHKIVLTGKVGLFKSIHQFLIPLGKLFNKEFILPQGFAYATAIGALLSIQ